MQESTEQRLETSRGWRIALLLLLVIGFLAFDYYVTRAFQARYGFATEFIQAICMGAYVVQIDLIAIWSAMGPGRMVVRIPWALLAMTLVFVVHQQGAAVRSRYLFSDEDRSMLAAMLLWGLIAATGSFFLYRVASRRRLLHRDASLEGAQHFHLQHLIGGIFLLSVTCGLLKAFEFPIVFPSLNNRPIIGVGIFTVVNLTITLPAIILSYRISFAPRYLVLAGICVLVTISEVAVFFFLSGGGAPPDLGKIVLMFLLMNVTQGFLLSLILSMVRFGGYEFRLVTSGTLVQPNVKNESPTIAEADPWSHDETTMD
ncbi:hypothetical protein [Blastopirellula marina]|uniref:Uncharacterized protein n=1 Tax=Blastopirellula marina DSM 3645 TaxID=314230 RepID=A3ZZF0_9BACT|nr:hypothetical protein [Blastopirellula marina]EAQ78113.1 hypothetical protein DSM3645_18871 [Blastopirellula marina DSM 3645]